MIRMRAVIDVSDPTNEGLYFYSVVKHDGTRARLKCELIHGHLVLPIDNWDQNNRPPLPSKQDFLNDTLGLRTWWTDSEDQTIPDSFQPVVEPQNVFHTTTPRDIPDTTTAITNPPSDNTSETQTKHNTKLGQPQVGIRPQRTPDSNWDPSTVRLRPSDTTKQTIHTTNSDAQGGKIFEF